MKKKLSFDNLYILFTIIALIALLGYDKLFTLDNTMFLVIGFIFLLVFTILTVISDLKDQTYKSKYIIVFLDILLMLCFLRGGYLCYTGDHIKDINDKIAISSQFNHWKIICSFIMLLRIFFQANWCKKNNPKKGVDD